MSAERQFTPGDRVRVTEPSSVTGAPTRVGHEFVVVSVDADGTCAAPDGYLFDPPWVEHAPADEPEPEPAYVPQGTGDAMSGERPSIEPFVVGQRVRCVRQSRFPSHVVPFDEVRRITEVVTDGLRFGGDDLIHLADRFEAVDTCNELPPADPPEPPYVPQGTTPLEVGPSLIFPVDAHCPSCDEPLKPGSGWKGGARMSVRPIFAWYDIWVGVFIDRPKRRIYVFPLPCLGLVVSWADR